MAEKKPISDLSIQRFLSLTRGLIGIKNSIEGTAEDLTAKAQKRLEPFRLGIDEHVCGFADELGFTVPSCLERLRGGQVFQRFYRSENLEDNSEIIFKVTPPMSRVEVLALNEGLERDFNNAEKVWGELILPPLERKIIQIGDNYFLIEVQKKCQKTWADFDQEDIKMYADYVEEFLMKAIEALESGIKPVNPDLRESNIGILMEDDDRRMVLFDYGAAFSNEDLFNSLIVDLRNGLFGEKNERIGNLFSKMVELKNENISGYWRGRIEKVLRGVS